LNYINSPKSNGCKAFGFSLIFGTNDLFELSILSSNFNCGRIIFEA